MNMLSKKPCGLLHCATIVVTFEQWVRDAADDIVAAATLLGGGQARAKAERVVRAVRSGTPVNDLVRDLRTLHRIVSLEAADDPFSEAAMRMMAIHPDDPRADVARRCAEALDTGLHAIPRLTDHHISMDAA